MARIGSITLALTVLVTLFTTFASGSSMASWKTANGPSLVIQDPTTGALTVSNCDNSLLNFPNDPPLVLQTTIPPRLGTSLTGTGWVGDDGVGWASIFYLDDDLNIVAASYRCDESSNTYQLDPDTNHNVPDHYPATASDTQLAVTLVSPLNYELAFTGGNSTTVYLMTICPRQECGNITALSQDNTVTKSALTIASSRMQNSSTAYLSVVSAKDDRNFELIAGNETSQLIARSPPQFTLPGWSGGETAALGSYIEYDGDFEAVFYIGSDRALYGAWVYNNYKPSVWTLFTLNKTMWPLADEPNSDFAVATDPAEFTVFIYYKSDGELVQVRGFSPSLDRWDVATPIATEALLSPGPSPTSTPLLDPNAPGVKVPGYSGGGWTTGKKVGLGFGIALAIIIGIVAFVRLCLKGRHPRQKPDAERQQEMGQNRQIKKLMLPRPLRSRVVTPSIAIHPPTPDTPAPNRSIQNFSLPTALQPRAVTPGPGVRPATPVSFSRPASVDTPAPINPFQDVLEDSSDEDDTILSERWNTPPPGGPGFEHIKPYTEFGNLRWSSGSKHKRSATMSDLSALAPPKSPTGNPLPTKSNTMSMLPTAADDDDDDDTPEETGAQGAGTRFSTVHHTLDA